MLFKPMTSKILLAVLCLLILNLGATVTLILTAKLSLISVAGFLLLTKFLAICGVSYIIYGILHKNETDLKLFHIEK